MAKKKLLKNIDVHFISLVNAGANRKEIIYKSAKKSEPVFSKEIKIEKSDADKHMVYGIVYSPDEVDTQGDFTTAEEIEKAAYAFMKNARTKDSVDMQHNEEPGYGFVAESWIVKSNDALFSEAKEGSWAVGIKIEDEAVWDEIKKGEIKGLSMGGFAVKEEVEIEKAEAEKEDGLVTRIVKAVKDAMKINKDFNEELAKTKLDQAIWALNDSLRSIMRNNEITDKKAAIIKDLEQFKNAIENLEGVKKSEKDDELTGINKNKTEDELTAEEITKKVEEAVEKAVKPIAEKLEEIEKSAKELAEAKAEMEGKIEKLEKATPGSKQSDEPVQKEDGYDGPNWLG